MAGARVITFQTELVSVRIPPYSESLRMRDPARAL